MDAIVYHKSLKGEEIRLCMRCNLFVTPEGLPDPGRYSPEWIEKFNARLESKCEHKRSSKQPMTVDELLAKLDAEYDNIAGELPELHRVLGFKFFYNRENPNCWPVTEAHAEIVRKLERQQEIRNLQREIRMEKGRPTA